MREEFELHEYEDDDLLPEYDLSQVERGSAYRPLNQGYTVTVHKHDGSTDVRVVDPGQSAVLLDPDVQRHFPDSESVNRALRTLISLFPAQSQTPQAEQPAATRRSSAPKRRAASARSR